MVEEVKAPAPELERAEIPWVVAYLREDIQDLRNEVREVRRSVQRLDERLDGGLARLDAKIDARSDGLDEKLDGGLARLDRGSDAEVSCLYARLRATSEKYPSGRGVHGFVEFAQEEQRNKEAKRFPPLGQPLLSGLINCLRARLSISEEATCIDRAGGFCYCPISRNLV